jgi:hypothetical protein
MQNGGNRTRVPDKDRAKTQGPKTLEKNREMTRKGSPDQGTH